MIVDNGCVTLRCRTRKDCEKQVAHYLAVIGKHIPENLSIVIRQDAVGGWFGSKVWG